MVIIIRRWQIVIYAITLLMLPLWFVFPALPSWLQTMLAEWLLLIVYFIYRVAQHLQKPITPMKMIQFSIGINQALWESLIDQIGLSKYVYPDSYRRNQFEKLGMYVEQVFNTGKTKLPFHHIIEDELFTIYISNQHVSNNLITYERVVDKLIDSGKFPENTYVRPYEDKVSLHLPTEWVYDHFDCRPRQ